MFLYFAVMTTKYEKQGKYLSYYCRMLSDILLLDRTNVSLFGAWDNDNKVTSTCGENFKHIFPRRASLTCYADCQQYFSGRMSVSD